MQKGQNQSLILELMYVFILYLFYPMIDIHAWRQIISLGVLDYLRNQTGHVLISSGNSQTFFIRSAKAYLISFDPALLRTS